MRVIKKNKKEGERISGSRILLSAQGPFGFNWVLKLGLRTWLGLGLEDFVTMGFGPGLDNSPWRVLLAPHTRRVVTTPAETEARVTRVETLPRIV